MHERDRLLEAYGSSSDGLPMLVSQQHEDSDVRCGILRGTLVVYMHANRNRQLALSQHVLQLARRSHLLRAYKPKGEAPITAEMKDAAWTTSSILPPYKMGAKYWPLK